MEMKNASTLYPGHGDRLVKWPKLAKLDKMESVIVADIDSARSMQPGIHAVSL